MNYPNLEPNQPKDFSRKPFWALIIFLVVVGILGLAIFLIGIKDKNYRVPIVSNKDQIRKTADEGELKKFASYDDLKNFLENNGANNEKRSPMGFGDAEKAIPEAALSSRQDSSNAAGSSDYSKTNVQVEGVDEADLVKTDGKYIYTVADKTLYITSANPAESSEILSKIEFKSRPQNIYLNGDKLAIYGSDDQIIGLDVYKNFRRKSSWTFFKVFDISDRKNPKQVRDLDFEGYYSNSRMIGDYVYFLTSTPAVYYDDEIPVPRILSDGKELFDKSCSSKCPDVYYFDIPNSSYNYTNIAAININDEKEEINDQVYLLSQSQNVYASADNLYITWTKYISEYDLRMDVAKEIVYPRLKSQDQEKISKIENTENFILSPEEKKSKINAIVERYENSLSKEEQKSLAEEINKKFSERYQDLSRELEKTIVHKIFLDKDQIEYKTHGEVPGSVLNQFSMDENDGYFRIATTRNRSFREIMPMPLDDVVSDRSSTTSRVPAQNESSNNLYVLDENLKVVGNLENLAPGERIYSVRFMQGKAYMVTFKQTDPLFVIGLDDPKNPTVLGKLKIPGFSNYLHPYDENTLIGIGKETSENESGGVLTEGLKLSLFDVSDINNPKEIDKYILGDRGSDSIALYDHKAFLFSKEKNLLVIPVTVMSGELDYSGRLSFNGAAVFKVDKSGFDLKGKISHHDEARDSQREDWCGYFCYDSSVKRSLYIDDTLWTVSDRYLKANKLDDLHDVKTINFLGDDDFRVIN